MYVNVDFSIALQKRICLMYQFPGEFPNVPDGTLFSTVTTALLTREHFIDTSSQFVVECITTGDHDLLISCLHDIAQMTPAFLIAHQEMIYLDLAQNVPLLVEQYPNSVFTDVIQRFRNDYELLQFLGSEVNREVQISDLDSLSILAFFGDTFDVDALCTSLQRDFFVYTDELRDKDILFLEQYRVFVKFFELCTKRPMFGLGELANLIRPIASEGLVLDLFSLLFLKRGDQFVCNNTFIQQFVPVLAEFTTSDFVQHAVNVVKTAKTSFFTRDLGPILESIENKNWQAAEDASRYFPQFSKLVTLAKARAEESDDPLIRIETGLTTFSGSQLIQNPPPEYAEICSLRVRITDDSMLNAIQIDKSIPQIEIARLFDLDADAFLDSVDVSAVQSPSFHQFINYLSLYKQCANNLSFDIMQSLVSVFKRGDVDLASNFAAVCGIDLFGFVLMNGNDFEITEDFVRKYVDKYRWEMAAASVTGLSPEFVNSVDEFPQAIKEFNVYPDFPDDEFYSKDMMAQYRDLMTRPDDWFDEDRLDQLDIASAIYGGDRERIKRIRAKLTNNEVELLKHSNPSTDAIVDFYTKTQSPIVFKEFPAAYDSLAKCLNADNIADFIVNAPPKKVLLLKAISTFPPQFFSALYDDPYQTIKTNSLELYITPAMAKLIGDPRLMTFFTSPIIVSHLLPMMSDKEQAILYWTNNAIDQMHAIKVDTRENELAAIKFFQSIAIVQKVVKNSEIALARSFVSEMPFTRFGQPYTLAHSNGVICEAYDLPDIYPIDHATHALRMLNFGRFSETLSYLNKTGTFIDQCRGPYDSTFRLLIPITKCPICDPAQIDQMSTDAIPPAQFNFYQWVCNPVNTQVDTTKIAELSCAAHREAAVSLLIAFRQFQNAVSVLMTAQDKSLFRSAFLWSAAYTNSIDKLGKAVIQADPALTQTRNLWDDLALFLQKRHMLNSLLEVYRVRNQLEEMANVALELFGQATSVEIELNLLGYALSALSDAERCRQDASYVLSPPIIQSSCSLSQIQHQKKLVSLMFDVCTVLMERRIVRPGKDLDLVNNEEAPNIVGALMFLLKDKELLDTLMKLTHVTHRSIIQQVMVEKAGTSPDEIIAILKQLPQSDQTSVLRGFLRQLSQGPNFQLIMILINTAIDDPKNRCLMFLEFDCLGEGFAQAINNGQMDLIPFIARRGAELGQPSIVTNCMRAMSMSQNQPKSRQK